MKKQTEKFKVVRQKISWKYRKGVINMKLTDLDEIFYKYSKHGLNMSQVQVQNEYGLDALEWQSLKRTFDLVKDSDVFSPYTLSLYSGKAKCQLISDKIAEKYNPQNIRDVIVYEDSKQTQKAYKKAIKDFADKEFRWTQFQNGLLEYITEAKKAPLVRTRGKVVEDAIVHICDIHFGAEIEQERNLPAYNTDVIAHKLSAIAKEVNSRKAKGVMLVVNGDLIETFTGLNHINSWKNIDKKYGYGVQATISVAELLTKFIEQVNNVSSVVLISGNHDRISSSNKEDVIGEVVQWVHFVLQSRFGKHFPVEWSKDVYTKELGGCGYIFTHGHLLISKKNPDHIVNQYGFAGMFNLVVMAHLHTRKVLSDNWNNRTIHAPSIFTGNNYSKNLGFSSLSGYLFLTTQEKYPVVIDVPIV